MADVRPGMADIIQFVRLKTSTAEDEVTIGGVTYWTDEQLQGFIDRYRVEARNIALISYPEYVDGVNSYLRYYLPDNIGEYIEADVFTVVDSLGNAAPSYTVDLSSRLILFAESTLGKTYYVRTRFYNVRPAIAEIWLAKAGLRVELIDWKAGGQNLNEDQEYKHCMEQYAEWSAALGIKSTKMQRVGYLYGW